MKIRPDITVMADCALKTNYPDISCEDTVTHRARYGNTKKYRNKLILDMDTRQKKKKKEKKKKRKVLK